MEICAALVQQRLCTGFWVLARACATGLWPSTCSMAMGYATLLKEQKIGVRVKMVEEVTVDEAAFAGF